MRLRIRREHGEPGDDGERGKPPEYISVDAAALTGALRTPGWLRDVGLTSWLFVGVVLLVAGIVALLALTSTIVMPIIAASIVAAVTGPIVAWLARHRLGRGGGAAIVVVALIVLSVAVIALIVGGIAAQVGDLEDDFGQAKDEISGWLTDAGVSEQSANDATAEASSSTSDAVSALLTGLTNALANMASLAFFLSITLLSIFFLLKDGPLIRGWCERNMGVPAPVARIITTRALQSLRGYFVGVTFIALFNTVLISLGAVALGVPLVGTIAVVTFFGAYIPYLGAWAAGIFTVLVTLGSVGTEAAIAMSIIQLLANGVLQQMVQPIAYGAALGIHPLAVLIVTIGGGALFGTVGLILGAPVTSAITRISADLARAREEAAPEPPEPAPPEPAPA